MPHRNTSIDGLRFVAALTGLFWHVNSFIEQGCGISVQVIFRGEIANVIFFMLSGFFVTYKKDVQKIRWYHELKRKVFRIYPLYACTVVYTAIVIYGIDTLLEQKSIIFKHLLCIQSWFPYNNASNELNGAAWFLSVLFFYWCITGVLIKKGRYNRKQFYALLGVVYMFYIIVYPHMGNWFAGIWVPWPFYCYVIGMILGSKVMVINEKIQFVKTCFLENMIMILLIVSIVAANVDLYYPLQYELFMILSASLIICLISRTDGVLHKLLGARIMQWGASLSMPLYLIHLPIVRTLSKTHFLNSWPLALVGIVFVGSIMLSWLFVAIQLQIKNRQLLENMVSRLSELFERKMTP